MTDKPYANHNFQLDRLCETFRQTEEALSLGIHDMHDRLEMERHVEQMKVDIAKLEVWQSKQAEAGMTRMGFKPKIKAGGNG